MVTKILRRLAFLISLIVLITSTVNTTYGFIVTKTDTIVNRFKPFDSIVNNLLISKTVEHPFGEDYVIPDDIAFDFKVELGKLYANTALKTTAGDIKADENGAITLSLKADSFLGIEGIDAGTRVRVTETEKDGDGFKVKNGESVKELTVPEEGSAAADFINVYTPSAVKPVNVNVYGTKILEGRDWQKGDTFSFLLEQKKDGKWVSLDTKTVSYNESNKNFNTFDFSDCIKGLTFDSIGEYEFRITEVIGSLPNMDYDKTVNTFSVKVTDADMDGKLEIGDVAAAQNGKVTKGDNGFEVKITFNNTFVPPADIDSITEYITVDKTVENTGELSIDPDGFEFILENTDTGEKRSFVSDKAGRADCALTFDEQDAGKVYSYKLYEKNDGRQGVIYDTAVYSIKIDVSVSDDNKLTAETTVNSQTVEGILVNFRNVYNMNSTATPETGDTSNIYFWMFLMVVSGAACVVLLIAEKRSKVWR